MIYFDNAATTFPKPKTVYDEIYKAMTEYGANPGRSGHKMAMKANREIFNTRNLLCKIFNVEDPMDMIFTFNCTQSLNIAIKGVLKKGDHVITTALEHNSVLRPIKYLEKYQDIEVTIVGVDQYGIINPKDIEDVIKENTRLIATTHISNLIGTINPIEKIGEIAKKHGIYYLVDAAQSAGVYDIDVEKMNIDLLAFPGHKGLLGPQGTGGLYIREGVKIDSINHGGTGSESHSLCQPNIKPDKFEAGTLNSPGIAGLGKGIEYILEKGIENIRRHEEDLFKHFVEEAKSIEGIKLYGPLDTSIQAAVLPLNFKDIDSAEIAHVLDDRYDIAVRPSLHCAPLAHEALGTIDQGAVRFSFGIFNSHEEVEFAIKALKEISKQI